MGTLKKISILIFVIVVGTLLMGVKKGKKYAPPQYLGAFQYLGERKIATAPKECYEIKKLLFLQMVSR